MKLRTVVVIGEITVDLTALRDIAAEFGWSVQPVEDVTEFAKSEIRERAVAVLFPVPESGWNQILSGILDAAPQAFPIVCHGSEIIPWPEMADAGAFHALRLPLADGEARQSLGFVWAALQDQAKGVFLVRRPASRDKAQGTRSAGSAA